MTPDIQANRPNRFGESILMRMEVLTISSSINIVFGTHRSLAFSANSTVCRSLLLCDDLTFLRIEVKGQSSYFPGGDEEEECLSFGSLMLSWSETIL